MLCICAANGIANGMVKYNKHISHYLKLTQLAPFKIILKYISFSNANNKRKSVIKETFSYRRPENKTILSTIVNLRPDYETIILVQSNGTIQHVEEKMRNKIKRKQYNCVCVCELLGLRFIQLLCHRFAGW